MKAYYANGTIGDAYVILCKLYSVAKKEEILCRHYTPYKGMERIIREIYSLLPNINVEFLEDEPSEVQLCGNFWHQGCKEEQNKYNLKPEYYPHFELGDLGYFNLPETYVTLQIKAGTHGYGSRSLSVDTIQEILNGSKSPVVVIGEKTINLPTKGFDIVDLRDRTTIKEVVGIIKNSKHFYGLLGFLSFVATSHKIMSDLWIESPLDINAVKKRQEAVEEWRKYLIRR